jgi:hypothetical protein
MSKGKRERMQRIPNTVIIKPVLQDGSNEQPEAKHADIFKVVKVFDVVKVASLWSLVTVAFWMLGAETSLWDIISPLFFGLGIVFIAPTHDMED